MQKNQQPSVLEIVGAVLAMLGFLHITGVLGKPGGPATLPSMCSASSSAQRS